MDMVNHPNHYTTGKIECIDAIESAVCGLKGIEAVCTANAIKYLWRWKQKNGAEDLKKATWYTERLLKGRRRHQAKNLKEAIRYIEILLKEVEKDE